MNVASSYFDPSVDYLSLACLAAAMHSQPGQAGADPNTVDPVHHRSVLHWAAFRGLMDVVRVALRSGADEQAVDADGYTYTDLLSAGDVPKVGRLTIIH